MKKITFLIFYITVLNFKMSGQFVKQTSGTSNSLYSVYFLNSNIGYAVGQNGTIIKTTNGGTNWEKQTSNTSIKFTSVYFINPDTGFIAGEGGYLLKTTDGGINWIKKDTKVMWDLYNIFFTDPNNGYIANNDGVLKTIDGGLTWNQQVSSLFNVVYSIYFINSNTGFAVDWVGSIQKTTNGGVNWDAQVSGTTNNLVSIYFVNSDIGYAVGNKGTILKTSNGGNNWTILKSGTSQFLWSVRFTDDKTGYVTGDESVLKTIDGGITWKEIYKGCFRSISFTDANNGHIVGINGNIIKTENGGENIDNLYVNSKAVSLKIFPNPTTSSAIIQIDDNNCYNLVINNMLGNELLSPGIIFTKSYKLDLTDFANGIYIISITNKNGALIQKKIIKINK